MKALFPLVSAGTPPAHVADKCLRNAAGGLAADDDPSRRSIGEALEGVTLKAEPSGEKSVAVSIAVPSSKLNLVRESVDLVKAELVGQFAHEGWKLSEVRVIATEAPARIPTSPPKKRELLDGLARAIKDDVKAYDVKVLCDDLGMPPHPDAEADPFSSKHRYVTSRLQGTDSEQMVGMIRCFLTDYENVELEELLGRYRPIGHGGPVKNLVFGSVKKPDLVLLDALSNDLGLVNKDDALIFDGGIPEDGLSWRQLVRELLPTDAEEDLREAGLRLYHRLTECLASDAERNLFHAYAKRYRRLGFDQPALVPQVWLHYDPKAAWQRGAGSPLSRQRMDFLLLLAGRRRVVLEVDGIHHYSDGAGWASTAKYAEMVRADRDLRLAGYEVYRFGGAELMETESTRVLLDSFLGKLFRLG